MGRYPVTFRLRKRKLKNLDKVVDKYPHCTGRSELVRDLVKAFLQDELNSDRKEDELSAPQGVANE